MTFSFGSAAKPVFGTGATTSTATGVSFGGFGTPSTAPASAPIAFGSTAATTAAFTGLTFGQPAPAAAGTTGLFNFAATPATSTATGLGFGAGTSTFGKPAFGTASTAFGTAASAFGTAPSGFGTATSGFASTLGTGLGTGLTGLGGTGLGGTGLTGAGLGGIGLTAGLGTANQVQDPAATLATLASAVSLPLIFGDERDAILAKWNQLQAFWGTGKGYYTQQGNFVDFTPQNPFCRFKAVGYSCLPRNRNKDGLVALQLKVKAAVVQANQQQLVAALHQLLGNKPTLAVCVEGVRDLPSDKCELVVYVQERTAAGSVRRVPASQLTAFLQQPANQQQLIPLAIEAAIPRTALPPDQLKAYLQHPPSGIDRLIWQQAKLDNPDPDQLLPVPMIGFTELHQRLLHQQQQTKLHQGRLSIITQDISDLQKNHANMLSKIEEYKRRHLELSHRVLQVMVRQETWRKLGYSMQAEEEQLRAQLEATQAELNAPTQFKGRLNELMSQMRMQHQGGAVRPDMCYQIDISVQDEIKQHLKQQQEGLKHLTSIIRDDLADLFLIEDGLTHKTVCS